MNTQMEDAESRKCDETCFESTNINQLENQEGNIKRERKFVKTRKAEKKDH